MGLTASCFRRYPSGFVVVRWRGGLAVGGGSSRPRAETLRPIRTATITNIPTASAAAAPVATGTTAAPGPLSASATRSEEHTSELQSPCNLVCRLLLEKKKKITCSVA